MGRKHKKYILTLLIVMIISSCRNNEIKDAVFTNLIPSISIDNKEYEVTASILNEEDLDKQIAKVTKVICIISYSDDNNPYKNIGRIYQLKNIDSDDCIAIEINDIIYLAEKIEGEFN